MTRFEAVFILYIAKKLKIAKLSSIDLIKANLNLGLCKMC